MSYTKPVVVATLASQFRLSEFIASTPYQEGNTMAETQKFKQPKREDAEDIAVAGLAFLASDPARLQRFLTLSGLTPEDIRSAAAEPGFLAGVLHHIMDDDRIAATFAAETGLGPEALAAAAALMGARWERDIP
jgi:uncharacterized protein DUF3572